MLTDTEDNGQVADKKTRKWNSVIKLALSLPAARVDRDKFLRDQLTSYCDEKQVNDAIADRPANAGIPLEVIDKLADACIKWQTSKTCAAAFLAGLPGGWAMLAALPVDVAQFYYNAIVLAQKLAYLYGWPSLLEDGEFDEEISARITMLVGVMFGVGNATGVVNEVAQKFAAQVLKKLPRKVLADKAFYIIIKRIARWIGVRVTKEIFARGVARFVPVLGGVLNAGLALAFMRPMAKRLKNSLRETKFAQPRECPQAHQ